MDIIFNLINNMVPLYLLIGLGFCAGKLFGIESRPIATLSIYVIGPLVFLMSVQKLNFFPGALLIIIISFFLCVIISIAMLIISKSYLEENSAYLCALASGTSNWGYFGLPIALLILDTNLIAIYIIIGFGSQIFESTLGVYYSSRKKYSALASPMKILKFPSFYAIIIGLVLSYTNNHIPYLDDRFYNYVINTNIVLGMMIIGLGLAEITSLTMNYKFLATIFTLRFLIWPLSTIILILSDIYIFGIFNSHIYQPLILFSIMPMAANNIAFASKFDMNPDLASLAVLATTLFAMIYVPTMLKLSSLIIM